MKPIPQPLIDAIHEYDSEWRHPRLARLAPISDVYSINPKETGDTDLMWPMGYPHAGRQRVYFLFNAEMRLIYIGKASCDSAFVQRFSGHLKGIVRTDATPKGKWAVPPKFLATLPMEHKHEAPSLEEWLILRFAHGSLENYVGNWLHPTKVAARGPMLPGLFPDEAA